MEDDEDDMYAPEEAEETKPSLLKREVSEAPQNEANGDDEDEEESEEEEEESDSDIDIITERKAGAKPEPVAQDPRVGALKGTPSKTDSPGPGIKGQPPQQPTKIETADKITPQPTRPGSSYPAVKTSNIDVDGRPIHEPSGKPIMEVDMDADFPEDKAWRRPGTDMTDYFNYGFDEFTWASYCLKQETLRKEAKGQKNSVEEMQSFLGGGMANSSMGMPPVGPQATMSSMGGMGDVPPEMQQMMQQMMSQGMDPSQMDFGSFMQMMQGGGGQPALPGPAFAPQGQNQQQMGYGYGAGQGAAGQGGAGQGGTRGGQGNQNQGGRGRGHRW